MCIRDRFGDLRVWDNTALEQITLQGVAISARCLLPIVQGGADADVARAILETKPAGIGTCGGSEQVVTHAHGRTTIVRFARVTLVPIALNIRLRLGAGFPSNGITFIKRRCAAWVSGDYAALEGRFETSGLEIGERLDVRRLLTPIQSVPGHQVIEYTVTLREGGGPLPDLPLLTQRYTLRPEDVTVGLSAG